MKEQNDNPGNDEVIFDEAIKLRDQGDFEGALNLLEQILSNDTRQPAVLAVTAHMSYELGKMEKAIELFRQLIQAKPKLQMASLGLFHSLWKTGRYDEAFEEMKRFQSIAYCEDYEEIVREIRQKAGGPDTRLPG